MSASTSANMRLTTWPLPCRRSLRTIAPASRPPRDGCAVHRFRRPQHIGKHQAPQGQHGDRHRVIGREYGMAEEEGEIDQEIDDGEQRGAPDAGGPPRAE